MILAPTTLVDKEIVALTKTETEILNGDYKVAMRRARKGAFVYLDPPYMPISYPKPFSV